MSVSATGVLPIIGYVTPLSASAGQVLSFKISSSDDRDFTAEVVRIDCADPNPEGPGMKLVPVAFPLAERYAGKQQETRAGSYAAAAIKLGIATGRMACELVVKPTLQKHDAQVLWALQSESGRDGVALALCDGMLVVISARKGYPDQVIDTGLVLPLHQWRRINAGFDIEQGTVAIDVRHPESDESINTVVACHSRADVISGFCLGAWQRDGQQYCYNGLIEAPAIRAGEAGIPWETLPLRYRWDLSRDMAAQEIPATGAVAAPLALFNLPTRAVRSSGWNGDYMDWSVAPDQYAAIFFHEDDLLDCNWETSVTLTIPAHIPSAVYGLVVRNSAGSDTIPFYVTPAKGKPRARILYLASTLTYQAYANHARSNYAGDLAERIRNWGAYPHNPDVVTEFGASTYNRHVDGAGIHLSSRLRPMLTMRPGYLTFFDPRGSGLRHFVADSHLTDWLREKNLPFDVITDEELDDQGIEALRGYDVVITGSHPEYHTRRMLDAILAYRAAGGSFMYMGGNGFYWKIARPAALPHVLEIRRAEGGIRAWASEPGEYYHQLDGRYGGMWRRNGLPPQAVGGVGFVVQGIFEGSYYQRTPESLAPDIAWLFDGVDEEKIGDYGLSGGGAAGFELDQTSPELGTPPYVKIVAVSRDHGPTFKKSPEEILTWTLAAGTPRPYDGVCAHMICGEAPHGGGLFASGSITFLGSLSHNGYQNGVSRIVENFLRRYVNTNQ